MRRMDAVYEARTWLGTPFYHLGRTKGVGVDCVGLLTGVCDALDYYIEDRRSYNRYGCGPDSLAMLAEFFDPIFIHQIVPGDLMTFHWRGCGHVAIRTPVGMIHTHSTVGRVIEHHLDEAWLRMLKQAWRFRNCVEA